MSNKRRVDFDLASEIFDDASLTDSFPDKKTLRVLSQLQSWLQTLINQE